MPQAPKERKKKRKKYIFLELHDMGESEDILVPVLKYFLNI
jgi:hypothetical protein